MCVVRLVYEPDKSVLNGPTHVADVIWSAAHRDCVAIAKSVVCVVCVVKGALFRLITSGPRGLGSY